MFFHTIVGFIFPWILGVYLVRNQTRIFIIIYPVGAAIAFLINKIGFNYFWKMNEDFVELSFPSLPYDIGLFPILSCLYICVIYYKKMPFLITFLVFTLGTSFIELLLVILGKLDYLNGWNIYWTAVSYGISYLTIYGYYKLVLKYFSFNKQMH
ncbi:MULTISPECIES: CBO0543 family protein [unclassified Bacillus (in: firmicutes)]|uniref:CBO0543 family protein n=1 Tax=unclassified Bacillus (in: firmicutes) TaxID=185979 RepID=UPI001BE5D9E6|nr:MULTISPECIES: CBO0543 family protein [unclassified Bacillus (in: firmicutes)]MBT2615137.1 hypothetical protein [Bacillus sp. ISL-78]MBT2628250.1 hypothetical protein [Bacillus sp. ISL-101]